MQQLLEYFAVIAFVAVYFLTKDVFLATGVLLAVIVAQVAWEFMRKEQMDQLPMGQHIHT